MALPSHTTVLIVDITLYVNTFLIKGGESRDRVDQLLMTSER